MNKLIPALLIVSTLGAAGCESVFGGSCTTAGCDNTFAVSITSGSDRFDVGTYDITVDVSGTPVTFVCTIAELAQNSGCTAPANAPAGMSVSAVRGSSAIDSFVVRMEGTPAEVLVDIDFDGSPVLTRTLTPSYTRFEPNGPDCGPVCRQAGETIAL